jgi:hypothetical protein
LIVLAGFSPLWAQAVQEDEDACKKAQSEFFGGYKSKDEAARARALSAFEKHSCGSCVGIVAQLLVTEGTSVRVAAAQALGKMDHPKAVEAVAQSVEPNREIPDVLEAIAKGLQTQDYEVGATILNPLLRKLGEKEVVAALDIVVPVLGKLGSPTSVEPLIDLLQRAENEATGGRRRLKGNPKIAALAGTVRKALEEITGGREGTSKSWEAWWKANRERLSASATLVYRCTATAKRWPQKLGEPVRCPFHDKEEKHGQLVSTRLVERKRP